MEYQRSRWINAAPDDVFRFASDLRNLPTYIPTVQSVEPLPEEDRVRVHGEKNGQRYDDLAWLKVDPDQRGLEWTADEHDYRGWMTVTPGENGGAQVVVHLTVPPVVSQSGRPLTGEGPEPDPVERSLEAALDSLRNLIEGTGGKETPVAVR